MLSFRKRVWTDQRLQLRAYYIKRKHQLVRNLDWRKLIIIRKNQVTMEEVWQLKAENKYRKQITELEGATRQDDIQEFNDLVRKRDKYMDKHKWIECTKFVALKVKAVWFSGFRKSTHK
jgi:23S rRNA C2498 (ribose-2'-O)-methylase RlmM